MSTDCLVKLSFFGMQTIVVHRLGHDQLKSLNKYYTLPSLLRMKKFFVEVVWDGLRNHPSQDLNEL